MLPTPLTLPEKAKVGNAARKALSHSAAIFVLYSTTQAMRSANDDGRKMISGNDVIKALQAMGFSSFAPELEATLKKFRSEQNDAKSKRLMFTIFVP